ncbi:hypothetical protein [Paraburkholderia acidisoli]|uniref:Uncharacterized protein n=1 Tax=Paraburkholderia acidisoli TaxID=2571748 RepID=A0A7Z2GS61_9BURK|nr:hypothetical protein [Paraburkholderia acidisoli]QGZ66948.1 hypothetical protein FAZ98_34470 [Paraburkholderia acidisoli]
MESGELSAESLRKTVVGIQENASRESKQGSSAKLTAGSMISKPRMGRITQGTVFCGACAEEYPGRPAWGVVITARCDTTHEKTPIVNYLPAVTVEDWLQSHGGLLSIDREFLEVKNKYRNLLVKKQLSESLLDVHSPMQIAENNFPFPDESLGNRAQKERKDAEDARGFAARLQTLGDCLVTPLPNREGIGSILPTCSKNVEAVVKELVSHRLSGYYFLPSLGSVTERASCRGYVVLLREVHHIPRRTVPHLTSGVTADDIDAVATRSLRFDCFDFAYPVAELQSPWTEHLMQMFCNLFGRIGVADADKALVAQIVSDLEFTD